MKSTLCDLDNLRFIFNRKLTFYQHIDFYANKLISTVKYMKIISNSNHSINPLQKHLLFRSCVLSITLYRFQLWYYKYTLVAYHLKILGKIQRRAAIWILGAFKTFPSYNVKAIADLIPINLHLQKLSSHSQLQVSKLPSSHLICSLIDSQLNSSSNLNSIALNSLTNRQCSLVKGHLVDMANKSNKCFLSSVLLIRNFLLVLELLTNFQNIFLSMFVTREKTTNCICKYWIKWS